MICHKVCCYWQVSSLANLGGGSAYELLIWYVVNDKYAVIGKSH